MNKLNISIFWSKNFESLFKVCSESLIREKNINIVQKNIELNSNIFGFRTNSWYECAKFKVDFFLECLINLDLDYLICSDVDIQFFQPKLLFEIVQTAKENDLEYYGTKECNGNGYNCGFYIIKKCKKIEEMLINTSSKILKIKTPFAEQDLINKLLSELKVNHRLIPNKYYCLGKGQQAGSTCCFHHAIMTTGIKDKTEQIKFKYKEFYKNYYENNDFEVEEKYGKISSKNGLEVETSKGKINLFDPFSKNPEFSVISLCCNRLEYTTKSINSICENAGTVDYEHIVVNQASTDGTKEWLEYIRELSWFNKIRPVHLNKNLGYWKGFCHGFDISLGEYIVLIDNDIVVETPNFLNEMKNELIKFRFDIVQSQLKEAYYTRPDRKVGGNINDPKSHIPYPTAFYMMHRKNFIHHLKLCDCYVNYKKTMSTDKVISYQIDGLLPNQSKSLSKIKYPPYHIYPNTPDKIYQQKNPNKKEIKNIKLI